MLPVMKVFITQIDLLTYLLCGEAFSFMKNLHEISNTYCLSLFSGLFYISLIFISSVWLWWYTRNYGNLCLFLLGVLLPEHNIKSLHRLLQIDRLSAGDDEQSDWFFEGECVSGMSVQGLRSSRESETAPRPAGLDARREKSRSATFLQPARPNQRGRVRVSDKLEVEEHCSAWNLF